MYQPKSLGPHAAKSLDKFPSYSEQLLKNIEKCISDNNEKCFSSYLYNLKLYWEGIYNMSIFDINILKVDQKLARFTINLNLFDTPLDINSLVEECFQIRDFWDPIEKTNKSYHFWKVETEEREEYNGYLLKLVQRRFYSGFIKVYCYVSGRSNIHGRNGSVKYTIFNLINRIKRKEYLLKRSIDHLNENLEEKFKDIELKDRKAYINYYIQDRKKWIEYDKEELKKAREELTEYENLSENKQTLNKRTLKFDIIFELINIKNVEDLLKDMKTIINRQYEIYQQNFKKMVIADTEMSEENKKKLAKIISVLTPEPQIIGVFSNLNNKEPDNLESFDDYFVYNAINEFYKQENNRHNNNNNVNKRKGGEYDDNRKKK